MRQTTKARNDYQHAPFDGRPVDSAEAAEALPSWRLGKGRLTHLHPYYQNILIGVCLFDYRAHVHCNRKSDAAQ